MEGGNNQTMLIVVALVGFCCLVSAGAGLYIYFNDGANSWFKKTFGIGDSDEASPEPAPAPDSGMGGVDDELPMTDVDVPMTDVEEPSGDGGGGGEDPPAPVGPGADVDCEANGSCARKGSTPAFFCRYPWKDGKFVNYDKNGKNPRCCPSGQSNYRTQCKPSLVNAMGSNVKQAIADKARDRLMKLHDRFPRTQWKKNGDKTCKCEPDALTAVYGINGNRGQACVNLNNGKLSVYENINNCKKVVNL